LWRILLTQKLQVDRFGLRRWVDSEFLRKPFAHLAIRCDYDCWPTRGSVRTTTVTQARRIARVVAVAASCASPRPMPVVRPR